MGKFEYIKCYWKYIEDDTPVLLFYEVKTSLQAVEKPDKLQGERQVQYTYGTTDI